MQLNNKTEEEQHLKRQTRIMSSNRDLFLKWWRPRNECTCALAIILQISQMAVNMKSEGKWHGVMQWCIRGVRVNCCTTMWRSSIWLVLGGGGVVGLLGIKKNDQSLICFLWSKTQSKPLRSRLGGRSSEVKRAGHPEGKHLCIKTLKKRHILWLKVVVTGRTTLLTKHNQFSWIAVFLSNHVGPNAHIHAGIAFLGIRNHQLPTSDLKMTARGGGRDVLWM